MRSFVAYSARQLASSFLLRLVERPQVVLTTVVHRFVRFFAPCIASLLLAGSPAAGASCPKILMFDGLDIRAENNEMAARFWGETVGVQGFFVNYIFYSWEDSVGDDEKGQLYQSVKTFQALYSRHGVTDNFIKVAAYRQHDWTDPSAETLVAQNFQRAAHLARYSGLKGIALDLEPHVKGFWAENPTIPDKADRVYRLGREVGQAIKSAYPEATVIVLPEILAFTCPPYTAPICQAYQLSSRFWDGLIQAHFRQLVLGTENSYDSARPEVVVAKTHALFNANLAKNGLPPTSMSIAPGLWPLGKSYADKRARCTPAEFEERQRLAMKERPPYIWIYGLGNTWKQEGGPTEPRFTEYLRVIHKAKETCE